MYIGTHHGKFHADEVFAIAILTKLFPASEIIRTRDANILQKCDIVVDVGRGKYDHHTIDKTYRENGIPYASAGLIWRDYGLQLIELYEDVQEPSVVATVIDEKVIQAIDAVDNGVDLDRDSRIRGISELIGTFNPPWNSPEDENACFHNAVRFAGQILDNQVKAEIARIQAHSVVESAFQNRSTKELLQLEMFCPWTDTLIDIDKSQEVLYVVFPDRTGQWRIQVVPKTLGTFEARKALPEAWAGKEGNELVEETGVQDAVFCHPARFIAGAVSEEGVLALAKLALSVSTPQTPRK